VSHSVNLKPRPQRGFCCLVRTRVWSPPTPSIRRVTRVSPDQVDPIIADHGRRSHLYARAGDRELRAQWQRAADWLLAEADVTALSKQVELALFFDAKLQLAK
jgi:hypothetical protein